VKEAAMEAATKVRAGAKLYGSQSMIAPLRRVLVHMPAEEYAVDRWREFGFEGEPDLAMALVQQQRFVEILAEQGADIEYLEEHSSIQTTSTYDPALITGEGAVMMKSGRPERHAEVMPMARKLLELDIPIIGWIRGEGRMDGGDTLWLDGTTLLCGRGYRSNDEGYRQLRSALDGIVTEFHHFELPHWRGPYWVLHLMSVVNLCSHDVALVYPRAMPVRLYKLLQERGYRFVETPDEEFDTQGCNALALAPGHVIMCAGNPVTVARLRDAGIDVIEYDGSEISIPRVSGPTCNTRPLLRAE
jgi:N-dimethylarginine dimethylaminohydrolase